ncbi:WYL domain-containing protein [Chloroflexus sp.]|uniref:WYL domain-containing protein n=1 Tax=Chloroflexus sp. TaxID=1904827 RepID=UPI002601F91E|nr:WYL domain-containing protein [uncultured Chloroflexus sp.]
MLRWAIYLAETPVVLQRLIAATHRVRWPRHADAATRLAALRQALCRPAAVRSRYFTLSPETQHALETLRCRRGILSHTEAEQLLGSIRSLRQLRSDREPRSVGEVLVLLGWLLPRPARPRHPAGWLLAPELRRWLPKPLPPMVAAVSASAPTLPPALVAAHALLVAAAEQPLPIRRNGLLAGIALRRLRELAPMMNGDLWQWLTPLLVDQHLLRIVGSRLLPGPALARFARASATERLYWLRAAWVALPCPERWLTRLRLMTRGLDWPAFRRRLLQWSEAMAIHQVDADSAFVLLTAALGPLVDDMTHCLWPARRVPWTRRSQQRAWRAAVAGPLSWLGALNPFPSTVAALPWHYDAIRQQVITPVTSVDADLLALQPWMQLCQVDQDRLYWQITPATIRRALAAGYHPRILHDCWQRRLSRDLPACAPPPDPPTVQIVTRTVAWCPAPETLAAAIRRPAVRRALAMQVAPGVALVAPGRERALARALARAGIEVIVQLSAQDQAAASAAQRGDGLGDETLPAVDDDAAGVYAAEGAEITGFPVELCKLNHGSVPDREKLSLPSLVDQQPRRLLSAILQGLRAAIKRRKALLICYQSPQQPAHNRLVQPTRLERHGGRWLLYAYCVARRAERCFRVDRILDFKPQSLPAPDQPAIFRHQRSGTARYGRLALSSVPPDRAARVWVE